MKLRVFLPASDRPDPQARFAWKLLDARGDVVREDATAAADIPRAGDCEAVVPASRVLFARLKLPKVGAATIRELLPYAVEDRLLADPSHIHAVAGPQTASGETLVAVVDRDWLQAMLAALSRAGLAVAHAWPESALVPSGRDGWHLVWGPRRGLLVDGDGGAATFDHDAPGALPLALRLALDEATARNDRPASVRVHAEDSTALPDLARWSAESNVAFEPGAAWESLARGAPRTAFELLQGEFAPRRRTSFKLPRAALVLAGVIAFLQISFVAIDAMRLQLERERLDQERETLFRLAFPEAKVVVDPDLQMSRNLAELKRTRGFAVEDDFLARLSRAAAEPGGMARSIEYSNGKLTVRREGAMAQQ